MVMINGEDLTREEDLVDTGFVPIADGDYFIELTDTREGVSAKGNNWLMFKAKVVDEGEHKDKFFNILTTIAVKTEGKSEGDQRKARTALSIGLKELNNICRSTGIESYRQLTNSQQVQFRPFRVRLKVTPQKGSSRYYDTNVTKYLEVEDETPAGKSSPAAAKAANGADGAKEGWRDRAKREAEEAAADS